VALNSGTRLGPYEIHSAIGAGGMGEVYRARDARLGRDVAIKVLPAAFSNDPERLNRFEQEARAAAALNHPNILAVYDVGTHDGSPYIVSELLAGETLRERLSQGALPVRKAIEHAVQICHGLAAAHETGITHRDLKPENIFLTTDGRVKILDFGLAKLTQPEPALANMSALATTPPNTVPGVVLGTVGYMAPEHVRGLPADHRSDIFAFGAVLYEMLSGRRAFRGDTAADTMTAILKEEPPDLPTTGRQSPPAVVRIVDRCLEKNPAARFQTASDLAFALDGLSSQSGPLETTMVIAASSLRRSRERLAWGVTALVLAVLLALALPANLDLREATPTALPELRTEIVTPSTANPFEFALSPDGRQMVFIDSADGPPRLWLRRLDTSDVHSLAGTDGASFPFWSPDSRSVGFFADLKLKRLDIGGGSPQTLADAINNRGGTWSQDGTILFSRSPTSTRSRNSLFRIPASGGEPVPVIEADPAATGGYRFPSFLPAGRHFLFYAQTTADDAGLYLGSLDSSDAIRLAATDGGGVLASNGWVLFVRGGALLAQRLEPGRTALTGEPVIVTDSVAVTGDTGGATSALSVSNAGLVAYRPSGANWSQLVWFDRSGKRLAAMGTPEISLARPQLSPDGSRVAVQRTVQRNIDLWLLDATRATRVTFDPGNDTLPGAWSPDGNRLVFRSGRRGYGDLYQTLSDRGGVEELLVESAQDKTPHDWSRDGRFLLFTSFDPETQGDIWVLPMEGDRTPYVWLKTTFDERRPQFSPDGRWVAYVSNESGRFEVFVRPFSGQSSTSAEAHWLVSASGGISPRWRADGQELYYIAPDGKLMAAPVMGRGSTFESGTPVALFQTRIVGSGTQVNASSNYDVSADGRFLINTVVDEGNAPITLLQNWQPERQR
jgi:serine/threonine protein kinase/Tol biopolymer transport system component